LTSEQAQVEVFTRQEQAEALVDAICRAATVGPESHGVVAVLPVEAIQRIKDYRPSSTP
jgi:nitrogen regulatory protein PII